MKKPLIITATVFLLIIGFLIWWFSDAQVIKRHTDDLAASFTMRADDGKAARISKSQALKELLDPDFTCVIELDGYSGEHRKDELVSGHQYLGQICETSQVKVISMEITQLTDSTASVQGEFSISVREKGGGSRVESSPARLVWSKSAKGSWKLSEVTLKSD